MRVLLIALISMTLAVAPSFAQSRGGGRSFAGHSVARGYGGGFRGGYYGGGYYGGRYYGGRYYGGVGLGFGLGFGYPYYYPYAYGYGYPYGYYPYYPYYYPAPVVPLGGAVVIGGGWRHFR